MKILDPCCGSKMFWFDRNNPNVILPIIENWKQLYVMGEHLSLNQI